MSVSIDLIELADLGHPEALANEIFNQNPNITVPIPLEEIAEAVGIKDISYTHMDGLEGALVANEEKTKGHILIHQGSIPERQRFTLGHELGHFLIPHHGNEQNCSKADMGITGQGGSLGDRKVIEAEANRFSSEILMPKQQFRRHPNFVIEPSLEAIQLLKTDFGVSFQACAHRYLDLNDYPVAIVFSHNGIVRYSSRSSEFPFWIIPNKSQPLPLGTLSHKLINAKPESSAETREQACSWVDESRDFELPEELLESVLLQQDGYMITMLYFDEEILETNY